MTTNPTSTLSPTNRATSIRRQPRFIHRSETPTLEEVALRLSDAQHAIEALRSEIASLRTKGEN